MPPIPMVSIGGGCGSAVRYRDFKESLVIGAGFDQPSLFAIFRDENGIEIDRIVIARLEEDLDINNSPFLDAVAYIVRHGRYPLNFEIQGQPSYVLGKKMPIEVQVLNDYEKPVKVLFPGPLEYATGEQRYTTLNDGPGMHLWIGLNDEREQCPACFSRFMNPVEPREIAPDVKIVGDLNELFNISAPKNYAVEGSIYIRVSPLSYYRDFLGKYLQFNVGSPTLYKEDSWGKIKNGS